MRERGREIRSEGGVEVGGHMCEQREVKWE